MMEVMQSQIQSHGSKLIIDQVIKLQSVSDFQSDFFLARELHAAILCVCGVSMGMLSLLLAA